MALKDNLICKYLIAGFLFTQIAKAQKVTVSGTCASLNTNATVTLTCKVENFSGTTFWYQNGTIVTADCSIVGSNDERIVFTKCEDDADDPTITYVNIKLQQYTDEEVGTWTCRNNNIDESLIYSNSKENGTHFCTYEFDPQPNQQQSCTLHFGSCEKTFNLNPVCAFPEPQVKLYRNGEDISDRATIDKDPDFNCSDPLDYKISATYKLRPTKQESVTYVYEVGFVEYPGVVFFTIRFVLKHAFCVWCIFVFPICPVMCAVVATLIFLYCKKSHKKKKALTNEEVHSKHATTSDNEGFKLEKETHSSHKWRPMPHNQKWMLSLVPVKEASTPLANVSSNGLLKKLLNREKTKKIELSIRILKNNALVGIVGKADIGLICFDGSELSIYINESKVVKAVAYVSEYNEDEILAIVFENRLLAIREPDKYNVLISLSNNKESIFDSQALSNQNKTDMTLYYVNNVEKQNVDWF